MFGEQQFIETPVIGLLLMFGVSPLVIALTAWRNQAGFCPPLKTIAGLSDKGSSVALLVVVAFVVGVVGNQVLDSIVDDELTIGFPNYEKLYTDWRCQFPESMLRDVDSCKTCTTLKLAEHFVADGDHEYARAYLLRHRSAVRVMRGAAAAAVLFLLSMAIYQGAKSRRKWPVDRYKPWHFLATAAAVALLTFTYLSEVAAVNRRVFELATRVRAKAAIEQLETLAKRGELKDCSNSPPQAAK